MKTALERNGALLSGFKLRISMVKLHFRQTSADCSAKSRSMGQSGFGGICQEVGVERRGQSQELFRKWLGSVID